MKTHYYIFFLLVLSGCSKGHLYKTPNGYLITRSAQFKFEGTFQLPNSSLLSVNKIYKHAAARGCGGMTFYPDGKMINTGCLGRQDVFVDTLRYGGYYSVTGDQIKIEMSWVVSNGMITGDEWGILVLKGAIVGDTIKFYKDQWYGKGKNMGIFTRNHEDPNTYYIRSQNVNQLRAPDW